MIAVSKCQAIEHIQAFKNIVGESGVFVDEEIKWIQTLICGPVDPSSKIHRHRIA